MGLHSTHRHVLRQVAQANAPTAKGRKVAERDLNVRRIVQKQRGVIG